MSKRKQAKLERTRRRAEVMALYLKSWTQQQIAERLQIHQSTVSRDILELHDQWLQSGVLDFGRLKAIELAKIDHLEREAWQAYERSVGTRQRKKMSTRGGGKDGELTAWEDTGDPKYLWYHGPIQRQPHLGEQA